ncbi:zinc-binding dehydrogenase [Halanaerobium kushneri]
MEEGKFKAVIGKTFSLEEISEAHKYVETGHKVGNAAIKIK